MADLTCKNSDAQNWLYDGGFELGITDYGQATLPGVGPVTALSLYAENADFEPIDQGLHGGLAEFVGNWPSETVATGTASPGPGVVAGWWRGPRENWYLVAAGDRDLRAFGSAGSLPVALRSGTFTVFSAQHASPAAIGPVLVSPIGADPSEVTAVLPSDAG